MENDFREKEINAKKRVKFHNEGNYNNVTFTKKQSLLRHQAKRLNAVSVRRKKSGNFEGSTQFRC